MIKQQVIDAFNTEFHFLRDKFEVMDLLGNKGHMGYDVIDTIRLPDEHYNIVWHTGVYVFIENNAVYRVGVSVENSRKRVMQLMQLRTSYKAFCIWDIDKFDDKSILLFNVKNREDIHWLLALEVFLERKFIPHIRAKRIG